MASHGHCFIALDHQDWSCFHTENKDGKPIMFEYRDPHCEIAYRKSQIEIRSNEIMKIIDTLKND